MFTRYSLRTTDLTAARAFYEKALGLELPDGATEGSPLEAWTLHERALALGVPAHWLGQIAVDDVPAMAGRIVSLGGQALGPTSQTRDGATLATFRDPFGTVMAIRDRGANASDSAVAWHHLHTRDADGAWAMYRDLFGWVHKHTTEVMGIEGSVHSFAWRQAGPLVGAVANTARLDYVHAHWQFFFPVDDIERAAASVRAHGGTSMSVLTLPTGLRICACEDAQRAAFGLAQPG